MIRSRPFLRVLSTFHTLPPFLANPSIRAAVAPLLPTLPSGCNVHNHLANPFIFQNAVAAIIAKPNHSSTASAIPATNYSMATTSAAALSSVTSPPSPSALERAALEVARGKGQRDSSTLSNYGAWRVRHVDVEVEVGFTKKKVWGMVRLLVERMIDGGDGEGEEVVLDSSYLDINDVRAGNAPVKWRLSERVEPFGNALTIELAKTARKGNKVEIEISMSTTEKCTALQWLNPAQTTNKKHPYMFSQCQAIHARSVFPCQDTPDVKSTFSFAIRSPLPVLASGLPTGARDYRPAPRGSPRGTPGTLLYTFEQKVPMPSYLFAVASGDIATAAIGPRSVVASGPEELSACKWELEGDMEKFLEVAEAIVYEYAWTTYNVLVLPPSFPYGGMENPIYTFATPTIISGDKQNIDVIAHELSHSWSGNLVSNASWEHFWLNEGWTTYLERRILAALHGEAHRSFSAIIGWKALQDSVARYGADHEFTQLIVDLKGKDPDDAFSSVPYEKGFVFLYHLEKLVGRGKWDRFIPHYFTQWKFKSLDSYDFKATLLDFFAEDADASSLLTDLDWDAWFYKPGLPPKPDFDDSLVRVCFELAVKWEARVKGGEEGGSSGKTTFEPSASDVEGWMANQSVVFLERVQDFERPLSPEDVDLMGRLYGFAASRNVELVARFYSVGLKAADRAVFMPTAELLGRVGRMKFVRPLFRLLSGVDRELAVATFERNKDFYHPICRAMVEKDLFGQ